MPRRYAPRTPRRNGANHPHHTAQRDPRPNPSPPRPSEASTHVDDAEARRLADEPLLGPQCGSEDSSCPGACVSSGTPVSRWRISTLVFRARTQVVACAERELSYVAEDDVAVIVEFKGRIVGHLPGIAVDVKERAAVAVSVGRPDGEA